MEMQEFIDRMKQGEAVAAEDEKMHALLTECSNNAMRVTFALNSVYHTPEEVRDLFSELTGEKVDESFTCFPPFYTDFGKNIHFGKHVFVNMGCTFQDRGGITVGDGTFIGSNVMLATLNHGLEPKERGTTYPAPIHIGKHVWIGANVVVVPGITIGDYSVIGAGAIVTKDVPPYSVAVGTPAKIIKTIPRSE